MLLFCKQKKECNAGRAWNEYNAFLRRLGIMVESARISGTVTVQWCSRICWGALSTDQCCYAASHLSFLVLVLWVFSQVWEASLWFPFRKKVFWCYVRWMLKSCLCRLACHKIDMPSQNAKCRGRCTEDERYKMSSLADNLEKIDTCFWIVPGMVKRDRLICLSQRKLKLTCEWDCSRK